MKRLTLSLVLSKACSGYFPRGICGWRRDALTVSEIIDRQPLKTFQFLADRLCG